MTYTSKKSAIWINGKTKAQVSACLRLARYNLERMCDARANLRNAQYINLQNAFRDLVDVIDEQERAHMRLGRRMVGRVKRNSTHETRVNYFVCKTLLEGTEVKSAASAYSVRRDYLIAQAIRDVVGHDAIVSAVRASDSPEEDAVAQIADVCYVSDLT